MQVQYFGRTLGNAQPWMDDNAWEEGLEIYLWCKVKEQIRRKETRELSDGMSLLKIKKIGDQENDGCLIQRPLKQVQAGRGRGVVVCLYPHSNHVPVLSPHMADIMLRAPYLLAIPYNLEAYHTAVTGMS